jgi:hypothetical protein
MPSLHIAWSSWCALVLLTLAPYLWVRVLGALYPVCTLFVILATANHWILDAAGGALTLAIAAWLQHALAGQRITEAPSNPAARPRLTAGDRFTSARVEGDRAPARIAGDRQ